MTSRNDDEQTPEPNAEEEAKLAGEVIGRALQPAREMQALTIERQTLDVVYRYGQLMAASGMFKDIRSAAQATVKILAGREIGLTPMQAMTEFHVIEGKVTASAHLMARAVKESGRYDYTVVAHNDELCIIDFFGKNRDGQWEKLGESPFSLADARAGQLLGRKGQMWEKWPRNMLFSRAMSNGVGWYCPDVFATRVYTPDELAEDIELDQYGNVQDVARIAVAPRQEEGERQQREQRPQQQRPAPRPPEPRAQQQTPEQINAGVFGNPGAVAKRAREELNLMPSEIEKRLGSRLSEWAGREDEAWRILSGGSEPVEVVQDDPERTDDLAAIPYPWGPAMVEACGEWGVTPEVVLAVLSGQPVASAEPWDSIYSRLDAVIKNPPREAGGNPTVALLVEYAAAALDDDSSADTPPTDSPAEVEPFSEADAQRAEAQQGRHLLDEALRIGATRAEEEPSADTPST